MPRMSFRTLTSRPFKYEFLTKDSAAYLIRHCKRPLLYLFSATHLNMPTTTSSQVLWVVTIGYCRRCLFDARAQNLPVEGFVARSASSPSLDQRRERRSDRTTTTRSNLPHRTTARVVAHLHTSSGFMMLNDSTMKSSMAGYIAQHYY